jgi:hypothetical protein
MPHTRLQLSTALCGESPSNPPCGHARSVRRAAGRRYKNLGHRLQVKACGQVVDGQVLIVKRRNDVGRVKLALFDMALQVFERLFVPFQAYAQKRG